MKSFLFYILFLINTLYGFSQDYFNVKAIKISGSTDKHINLVILSDGYLASEFDQFIIDATNFSDDMFSQSPFLEYANYFNVYAIEVPSEESGADHPGTATDVTEPLSPIVTANTYFNATFDAFGFHRLLFYEIDGNGANNTEMTINMVLANNFPDYDQVIILVNSDVYGGSGGKFPMASTGASANEIAIHELGHSLFDLKDEYYPGDIHAAEAINMTQETSTSLVKWKNWVGTNGVGIYPHANSGTPPKWYKPHQTCKMQFLGFPFCSVCKEGIIEKIHNLVSPIASYVPDDTIINVTEFPLDFQLNLIKPIPNTLESSWTLNAANIANNADTVSIIETESSLVEGTNTLTAVVNDATSLLKVDNHETIHIYTVTWTINYSTLGINDITSQENKFTIKMFPNPANTIVTFKIESDNNTNLKVDMLSIDGKKLKTTLLSNYKNAQIDISSFSNGVYIANFYSNNTLLVSKKFVKN